MTKFMTFLEFIEMSDPTDMGCGNQYICHTPESYRNLVLQQTFYDYARILMTEYKITEELKEFFHSELKKTQSFFGKFEEMYLFGGDKPDKKYARKKLKCKVCGKIFYDSLRNYSFKESDIEGTCCKCNMIDYDNLDYNLKRYFEGGKLFE